MSRNYPSFIEAFLDYNKNLGVSQKFLLWSAISGIAGCLERRTWIVYNGTQVIFPNLFVMLIADSGIANKSTAGRAIMELLYEVDGLNFMSTQMSGASLIKQMSDAGNRKTFEYEGVVYKNSSIFSYSSEAKVTIGDAKGLGGVQELLTDFYDCGDPNIWSVKKGWNKETLSGGDITIFNPCLNLLYCSTPTWLMEAIGKNGIAGGFASRVLFISEKERFRGNLGWLDEEEVGTKNSPEERNKLIADLNSIASMAGRFKTTKGFKEAYNEILEKRNAKIDENPKGEMASYYSRKMWHCLKLSQVLAADQSDELIITPEHLMAACRLLETIESDMYAPFSTTGENKNLMSFSLVWEVMRKKPQWTKQDLVRYTYKHATSAQLDEHLKTLVTMKKIKFIPAEGQIVYAVLDNSAL
jgi:hypothetical protein